MDTAIPATSSLATMYSPFSCQDNKLSTDVYRWNLEYKTTFNFRYVITDIQFHYAVLQQASKGSEEEKVLITDM